MLVLVVVVPLFLGIFQVALVLHVRNTLVSAASEGARYAATVDRPLAAGVAKTQEQITGAKAQARILEEGIALRAVASAAGWYGSASPANGENRCPRKSRCSIIR